MLFDTQFTFAICYVLAALELLWALMTPATLRLAFDGLLYLLSNLIGMLALSSDINRKLFRACIYLVGINSCIQAGVAFFHFYSHEQIKNSHNDYRLLHFAATTLSLMTLLLLIQEYIDNGEKHECQLDSAKCPDEFDPSKQTEAKSTRTVTAPENEHVKTD